MSNIHEKYMNRALELAAKGRGRTSPNPMVGCVIVNDGKVVGEGHHTRAGEEHAERAALREAGERARNSTVYVSLEPCSHHGLTPPCTSMLIEAGISKVHYAMTDPDPRVSGKGARTLEDAGITVRVGPLQTEALQLNEAYVTFKSLNRPFVTVKTAMSLDGKIATRTGDSRWITGERAREFVHRLRNEMDAIMVGARTVALDDPLLTSRLDSSEVRSPIRVIVDASASVPPTSRVFSADLPGKTVVFVAENADCGRTGVIENEGGEIVRAPFVRESDSVLDMSWILCELASRGIVSVLVEGGGVLNAHALDAGIVDKLCIFISPKIVGGRDAPTPVDGLGIERMKESLALRDISVEMVGCDILVTAYTR
ncbi:bifunctional diaminohydroxyphosphoribosylaminopyrimidine deaminase/5-amino-6-(5-phosphoribosylamino)uracil reductase RibD [Candidatus Hydrogenedentota bacterium]